MVRRFLLILLCLLPLAAAAEVKVLVERSPASLEQPFRILFEVEGDAGEADFSPLAADFEVLDQSQSHETTIINGRMSRKVRWIVTVMARRAGKIMIPAIRFGQETSPKRAIQVVAGSAPGATPSRDIFLEAEMSPPSLLVQAQGILTVRVFLGRKVSDLTMGSPEAMEGRALFESLGEDQSFNTTRDGRRYTVVERRFAVYPQQSGPLRIKPVQLEGRISDGRFNSLLDEFFNQGRANDPFSGMGGPFLGRDQPLRVQSNAVTVEVLPMPEGWQGPWLPARKVELRETFSQDATPFRVGEPITRAITLHVDGLTAAQLPEVTIPLPDGIKGYADQPVLSDEKSLQGVTGSRMQTTSLIAHRAGRMTLPAIEVPWHDGKQRQVARLPERIIEVLPALGQTIAPPATAVTPKVEAVTAPPAPPPLAPGPGFWPWLTGLMALGWGITALFLWRAKKDSGSRPQEDTSSKAALRALREACRHGRGEEAREAVLAWGRIHFADEGIRGLSALANRAASPELGRALANLNRALYGPGRNHWKSGEELFAAVKKEPAPPGHSRPKDQLAPLYP